MEITIGVRGGHPVQRLGAVRVQLHALRRLAEAEGCDPEMVREPLAQIDREIEAIVWLVREALGEAEPSEL